MLHSALAKTLLLLTLFLYHGFSFRISYPSALRRVRSGFRNWETNATQGFSMSAEPEGSTAFEKHALVNTRSLQLPALVWKGLMLLICVIWATNFAVIKKIFDVVPEGALDPSLYVAIRFGIAAAVMLPGLRGTFRNKGLWKNGIIVGLCVFLGYIGQSMGILANTASKTAFFCSMNVVWVALVTGFMRRKFQARTWVSVLLAISGAAFIELKGFEAATVHDLWLLLQPIGFGSGYLFLEQNMKDFPDSAQAITSIKLLTVAVCTILWAVGNGHTLADLRPIFANRVATAGLLYTGLVTTAFAIFLQSVVFKRVSSTDASIILTSEPIWAALFAVALIGERISRSDVVGGSLIVLGCLVNEIDVVAQLKKLQSRSGQRKSAEMGPVEGSPDHKLL